MKIIKKSKEKPVGSYEPLDVLVIWNDCEKKQYVMLVNIESADDEEEYQAILLHSDDYADDEGSNDIAGCSEYGYGSYDYLVADLKSHYDHIEKVANPALLVNGDD